MRKSIATVSLSGTLEEKLTAAAQAGFDGVEIFENDLITSASSPGQIRRRAADLGIRVELYQPFRDFEAVPAEVLERNLDRADRKFALMNELGAGLMLVCSNVSRTAVDDDALAAAQLRRLAERAERHGVRIAYEALAWGRHVGDYRHSWRIVEAAGHPCLGVCLDSFHILSRRSDPARIREIPGEKIFFLQLADAPRQPVADLLQWSRHYRCLPGQGDFDLPGFLAHVLAAGYGGPLSLEVFNDVFRQADAERIATDAMRSLIMLEDALRQRPGDLPAEVRDRVALTRLPAAAGPEGYAFVELAVDPLSELAAERLLNGMGFIRAGRHRSKPVGLWRQGGARVLLNRRHPGSGWAHGDVAVSAIAVESPDPASSAVRAAALLAPAVPRASGPDEAALSAVAAPDGVLVFFCRTGDGTRTGDGAGPGSAGDPAGWPGDFVPATSPGPEEPLGVTGIDHVALSQPPHAFEEAALFYESVLDLRRSGSEEVADPHGLVRSRAVADPAGRVRFVLTVPLLGGGRTPETAGFQHIALACTDALGAARRMRERGMPLLPIPGNYYDDLAARTDLPPARIAELREAGVLYDRAGSGEFLHFYTATLGRRVFFEFVQRIGGYQGYGAANTPVRMAAQYRHTAGIA